MSGPKVVRVVTREELEAAGARQLQEFEAVATSLKRLADRLDASDRALDDRIAKSRELLTGLFKAERWRDLQSRVAAETDLFRVEIGRLEQQAIQKAEFARSKSRRLGDTARTVAIQLEKAGLQSDELKRAAKAAEQGSATLDRLEAELTKAIAALTTAARSAATDAQRDLAARLATGELPQTLATWTATITATDSTIRRLDRLIAEVDVLEDNAVAKAFHDRAELIRTEQSASQRALLADSLTLDLSSHIASLRAWAKLQPRIAQLRADLIALKSDEARQVLARLDPPIEARNLAETTRVLAEADQLLIAASRDKLSTARRAAVLRAFAALGYEVRETMAGAWVRSGRLVVKKPGATDYGLELAAVADADRIQVRVVGATNPVEPRSASRDKDAETQWCTDFDRLQKSLARAGAALHVERASPVGAVAVKDVSMDEIDGDRRVETRKPIERLR